LNADGSAVLLTSSVEIGQGTLTSLAQIVAEELGLPIERVSVTFPDTDVTPFDQSTSSSRTIFNMGNAAVRAAHLSSCLVLATNVEGKRVTTIEGLAQGDRLDPVQEAFLKHQAFQCGYCTPGMIMATKALLDSNPHPTEEEIRDYLSGNLCRCGTYGEILAAIKDLSGQQAAATRK